MLQVESYGERYFVYDANHQRMFVYLFEDYESSLTLVSRQKVSKEDIESVIADCNDHNRKSMVELRRLDKLVDDKMLTKYEADHEWEKFMKSHKQREWREELYDKYGMKPLVIEQECSMRASKRED